MRRAAGAAVLGLALAGCSVIHTRPGDVAESASRSWPPNDPRVELAAVLANREDLRGHDALRWLRGDRKAPLFSRPYGVAWSGDDLLVADPGAARVLSLGKRGRVRSSRAGLFVSPAGVAACAQGVVVSDPPAGRVALLDQDLRLAGWLAEGLRRPTGIACIGARVYAVETGAHRVVELQDAGSAEVAGGRGEAPGRFNFPTALAADGATLWIGDTLNFRVQRIDPASGSVLAVFGTLGDASGEMPRIKGLAVDRAGRLWLSDALLDQVSLYTRDGGYLMSIGRHGDAPGEFYFPAGIAARSDGRVAIADSLNGRIQVLQESREGGTE